MTLMTRDDYIASLSKMKKRVFIMGQQIENPVDHPSWSDCGSNSKSEHLH